jgi:mono/diheme cytochrome c family protein
VKACRARDLGPVALGIGLIGCSAGVVGATDADLARAGQVTARGALVFARDCAGCHGRHGEGMAAAPPIMGPGALPEFPRERPTSGIPGVADPSLMQIDQDTRRTGSGMRGPFRNEADVYQFLLAHQQKTRNEDDVWAIVTFMMAAQGAAPPGGVSEDTAEALPIPRR